MSRTRDEVLAEYLGLPTNDEEARRAWVARHPQYAADVSHISVVDYLAGGLEPTETERTAPASDRTSDAAQSARLTAFMREAARPTPRSVLADGLLMAARAAGHAPARLASALGVGLSVLARMDRRLLAPESIPRRFVLALANALARSVDEVSAYLALPPTLSPRASYRARLSPRLAVRDGRAQFEGQAAPPGRILRARHTADGEPVDGPAVAVSAAYAASADAAGLPCDTETTERQSFADAVRTAPDMSDADKAAWVGRGASGQ